MLPVTNVARLVELHGQVTRRHVVLTSVSKNCQLAGDAVPGTDFGSLFHFSQHCGLKDLIRLISISHTVTVLFL